MTEQNETRFLTIKQAAAALNIPYWKLLRAVNLNLIRHYSLFNGRKLVRLTDVVTAIESSSLVGGVQ